MTTDIYQSSDSVRSSRPLRHAQTCTFSDPLKLELGGQLPECHGRLRNLWPAECRRKTMPF